MIEIRLRGGYYVSAYHLELECTKSSCTTHSVLCTITTPTHIIPTSMASKEIATAPKRKLKPARKQVEAGDIDKTEAIQPGKEYSMSPLLPYSCMY
jgi:hypothetical protein